MPRHRLSNDPLHLEPDTCKARIASEEAAERDDRRADTGQTYSLIVDAAEITTILAALRYFQADLDEITANPGIHFEENDPLTFDQINALCEYINLDA